MQAPFLSCMGHVSLPQPTQEITDFQGTMHEWRRSARDKVHSHTILVCQCHSDSRSGGDWRKGHGVPVGVFEADASLLELISVFQFGHILGVDGRFRHGFLEIKDIAVIAVG